MVTNAEQKAIGFCTSTNLIPSQPIGYKLPNGKYHVRVAQSRKTGRCFTFSLTVIRGPHTGRHVYFVLDPESYASRTTMSQLCLACRKPIIRDSDELAGVVVLASVKNSTLDGIALPVCVDFEQALFVEVQ